MNSRLGSCLYMKYIVDFVYEVNLRELKYLKFDQNYSETNYKDYYIK